MRKSYLVAGFLSSTIFMIVAGNAQNAPQQTPAASPPSATIPMKHPGYWRASKLGGVDVYNNANEKIGDIQELLIDPSGKVAGIVIGVGGFLGVGEHDVFVKLDQIKFVNEPIRSASSDQKPITPTNTTGSGATASSDKKWYPDHAVLSGATKDSLKNSPEFKFD